MNTALSSRGYSEASYAEYRTRVGWGLHELVRRSLPEDDARDEAIIAAIASEFRGIHFNDPVKKTRPFPGIVELLDELVAGGIPLFVHTNKPDAIARRVVSEALVPELKRSSEEPFRGVLGQRDDLPRKPDPAGVVHLLSIVGLTPSSRCWYIGDSEVDIDTARAAGCTSIGVTWGFRDTETIRSAGADHICYSVDDIRSLVRGKR